MRVAIYNNSTGEILRIVTAPPEAIHIQVQSGEEFFLNPSTGSNFIVAGNAVYVPPPEPPLPTLAELKTAKYQEIAIARFADETGGIVINGVTIPTDRESQATLTGTVISMANGYVSSVRWKTASSGNDGQPIFISVGLAQILDIASKVAQHVETAFAKEEELCDRVVAATNETDIAAVRWT
jgi:hypothetical protein